MFKSNTTYESEKFQSINFQEQIIEFSEFYECTFVNCDFSNSTLSNCTFTDCKFEKCIFASVNLTNSSVHECEFKKCKLIGIDWSNLNTKMGLQLKCTECDLSYSTFLATDISNSTLESCKIHEVDFTDTNAKKCSFKKSDFEQSTFNKTNLTDSNFTESKNLPISIKANKLSGSKFTYPEILDLLEVEGIEIVEKETQ